MDLLIAAGSFIVAFLYSSVGHGGASGYLALLSFTSASQDKMATTALIMNLLVASISLFSYVRAKYFSWRLTWPFVISSIPMAFVGGLLHIPLHAYELLLAAALLFSAYRLAQPTTVSDAENNSSKLNLRFSLPVGGVIGLVSGIIGVGGGIFLSPVILLCGLAGPKTTAATSAFFILVNAMAGLAGRASRSGLEFGSLVPIMVTGCIGGVIGSYLGASKWNGLTIRRVLAVVLVMAASKLVIKL
jgi:uncharacterized protein